MLLKTGKNVFYLSYIFYYLRIVCEIIYYSIAFCVNLLLPPRRKQLNRDIILITGGGKGIGKCIALEIAKHGPKTVILWGRCEENLNEVANLIMDQGCNCLTMRCDVSNKEDVFEKAKYIRENVGAVTMVINNAGVVSGQDIRENDSENMLYTMRVNCMALIWTTRCFLPDMLAAGRGHIVSINSMLGLVGVAGCADYCASKYAATGFLDALRAELTEYPDVHVTSVHPYIVNTDMFRGCQVRFPRLFPSLEKEHVARKTVDAIVTNRKVLIMPRLMALLPFFKTVLPVEALLIVHRFFGVDKVMQHFHGRVK